MPYGQFDTNECVEEMSDVIDHLIGLIGNASVSSIEGDRVRRDVVKLFKIMAFYQYNDGYADGCNDTRESMEGGNDGQVGET